jgi:dTDP-4-dehydrorhamnose reductase
MKIHVLGVTGMLGCYIFKYLSKCGYCVIPYTRRDIDALSVTNITFKCELLPDDVIINCVGLLKPNIKRDEDAIKVNCDFPYMLEQIAGATGCRLINFSSDCVFNGNKGNYSEKDECDARDIYGVTKTHANLQSTVLRLSFIGEELYNKIGLLEFALKNANKSVTGYTNCLWNGVTGLEIAKIIEKMLRNDGVSFWSGVRHVYSDRVVSKYEILSIIDAIYNLNLEIIPTQATEICGTLIENTLDRSLITVYNKIQVPTLEEMIYEQRNFIYEN